MAREVKVTVRPSSDHPEFLTVQDAMLQIADVFALLERDGDAGFEWKLKAAHTNSPFTATGEAVSITGASLPLEYADEVARQVWESLGDVLNGEPPPYELDRPALRRMLLRNQNGIGSTEIDFGDGLRSIDVTPNTAGTALAILNAAVQPSFPKRTRGSLEGELLDVGHYRGQPALKLRVRRDGRQVWCRISEGLQPEFASKTTFKDVWQRSRVRMRGWIEYTARGLVANMDAETIVVVQPPVVSVDRLLDPTFTGGLDPETYLDRLRDGELG